MQSLKLSYQLRALSSDVMTLSYNAFKVVEFYDYVALGLDGLTELSSAVANILAAYEGALSLNGLSHISDEVAELLGKHKGGGLYLNKLVVTSEYAANNLIKQSFHDLEVNILDGTAASAAKILRDSGHGV
jgi:hypothetical protein